MGGNAVSRTSVPRPSWSSRTTIPRASRKTTGGHEGHASTAWEARSIGAGLPASDHFSHSNFFALWFYFRAVEGLLVTVSHLYDSSCCSRWPKGSGFSHQPFVDDVQITFKPCCTRNAAERNQRWIRSWRTWRCSLIQPVSSSRNVSSSGLPCNVHPGSPFKSWLDAYVQRILPLQTSWMKHYVCASFARWTMKPFLRHFLRWRRTSSTSPLLSWLLSKRKTPPKLWRRRSTAQNPFLHWRLHRNRLDNSHCLSALPRRKCQLDSNDATVVAIQAVL